MVVLGGLAVTGVGYAATSIWRGGGSDLCADGTPRAALSVTVAPALAAPVRRLATDFQHTHVDDHGPCVTLSVRASPSDRTLDAVARADPSGSGTPDVWIPESADWLSLGQESDSAAPKLPQRAATIAGSPVVIAMPRAMAQQLGWPEHHMTWAELAAAATTPSFWATKGQPSWGGFRLAMANPDSSAAALRALIGTVSASRGIAPADMATGTFDQDRAAQAAALRLQRSVSWLPQYDSQLFDTERKGTAPAGGIVPSAFPAMESDVIAYNRGLAGTSHQTDTTTLVAAYPRDGSFVASVPYIVLTHTSEQTAKRTAAQSFLAFLGTTTGRQALSDAGLRTPAELADRGDPAGLAGKLTVTDGVRTTPPKLASVDASDTVLGTARRFFRHARERAAALVVIDTSGSTRLPITNRSDGKTRIQAATETVLAGLSLFASDSALEVWLASATLPGGHQQLAPMASLNGPSSTGGTHADELRGLAARVRADRGSTNLYSTVVAAVRDRRAHFVPGRLNEIILLTDGVLDRPDGASSNGSASGRSASNEPTSNEPTLDQAVAQLRATVDRARPVHLIIIATDPAADTTTLQRLASATGGRAYITPDAAGLFGAYTDVLTLPG
ncbi:Bacterial extracellular solute-binding protein/von Willebrand factor type A domain [Frankia sp. AiPs1]|uniref:substrate-binding domain-containing protein n=1 Tax=Frankia sp. AiPa1 TaxID=573492 RepID=UPI00202B915A|nr:substrate-binding domain-containing protein [Frankia sp. AiPa1]MCL9761996.1 substrate-binding and VWA domain-containing protein [Frankia sp. AiPa1]